jgi:hypothetical protein
MYILTHTHVSLSANKQTKNAVDMCVHTLAHSLAQYFNIHKRRSAQAPAVIFSVIFLAKSPPLTFVREVYTNIQTHIVH